MKYSLRSLMIVVTLVCVVVGGRIEFLRRQAEFYEQRIEYVVPGRSKGKTRVVVSMRHRTLAERYRKAMFRPWTFVDERTKEKP